MAWTAGIVLTDTQRWVRCFFPETAVNNDVVGVAKVGKDYHAHRPAESDMLYGIVDEDTGNSATGVTAGAWGYVMTDGAGTMRLRGPGSPPIASGGYVDAVINEPYGTAMDATYGPTKLTFAYTSAAAAPDATSVAVVLNSQIYRQNDGLIGG